MVKRSDDNIKNQFITLLADKKDDIDKLINKITTGHEFEFIFKHGFNTLNKELYIYLLKYINIVSSSNKQYSHDGPNEMLSVNLSLNENETYRITVNNTNDNSDNIKMIYSNLITKSSNYSVFKMLLYLAKRSKDNKKYNIMKKVRTPENTVDIDEFDIRAKLTDEIDLFKEVVKKSATLPKVIQRMLNNEEFTYDEIQENII